MNGILGPTVLSLHPPFDLCAGVVIDDLHGLYLGVTLRLLNLWFDKRNKREDFYIGDKVILLATHILVEQRVEGCVLMGFLHFRPASWAINSHCLDCMVMSTG